MEDQSLGAPLREDTNGDTYIVGSQEQFDLELAQLIEDAKPIMESFNAWADIEPNKANLLEHRTKMAHDLSVLITVLLANKPEAAYLLSFLGEQGIEFLTEYAHAFYEIGFWKGKTDGS
jgi:hypothetical protein